MLCKSVKLLHLLMNSLGLSLAFTSGYSPPPWRESNDVQPAGNFITGSCATCFDLNSLSDLRIGANEYLSSAISFNLVF